VEFASLPYSWAFNSQVIVNVARINARPVQRFASFGIGQGRYVTSRLVFSQRHDNITKCITHAILFPPPLQLPDERHNLFSVLYCYIRNIYSNASLAVSRRNLRHSEVFDGDIMRLKVNCRPRHSKNAVPFVRIESAVASMGVNISVHARGWVEWNFQTGRFIKGYR